MSREGVSTAADPDVQSLEAALRLHEAGELDCAERIYLALLAAEPAHHESLHLLGLIRLQRGGADNGVALIRSAIRLAPGAAHYRSNLGKALAASGRLREAREALAAARSLRPESPAIASNLGAVLTQLGEAGEAVRVLRAAVSLDPALADAHYNLANALCATGARQAALPVYAACLRLRPDWADAHFNLGHALARLGRAPEAVASFRRALAADPAHVGALGHLGVLLHEADRVTEAADMFRAALKLRPGEPDLSCNLGASLLAMGLREEAAGCFERVLAERADHGTARLGRLMAHLPVVPRNEAEVADGRRGYARELAALASEAARNPVLGLALGEAAGRHQPFFLPYQGEDDRALQAAYGGLMHALADPSPASFSRPARAAAPDSRLLVGVVSGFFCEHTLWTLFLKSWLEQIDRSRFRVFAVHTGPRRDAVTDMAAGLCERFITGPRSPASWRRAVLAEAPDVLLYPETGLDSVAFRLAAQRLAQVQGVAWGQPVTSGLPSLDFFLTSALMNTADAQAVTTERLIALPNLGVCCDEPSGRAYPGPNRQACRAEFGLREGAVVYWSGQNLAKYQPRHDAVFARIAEAVPDSQFLFIGFGRGEAMTRLFAERLGRAFAARGLDAASRCVILPQQSQERFLASASVSDVVLDPIGWSGGKSTLDLLPLDPVIVTHAGRFLRGRHTAAVLTRVGAAETVADSVDSYVEWAVRLGGSPALRQTVRRRLARGRHLVWNDTSVIRALEDFLEAETRRFQPGVPAPAFRAAAAGRGRASFPRDWSRPAPTRHDAHA